MSIDDVLSLIVALSPADRRRLFRRAQRMALLDVRDLVPDPSSTTTAREQEAATPSSPRGDKTVPAVQPPRTPAATTARLIEPKPATTTVKPPPSRQPGRAPAVAGSSGEARVRVVFDGGSKGNPGAGYGSYALQWPGQAQPEIVRLEFSGRMTNNEAEYDTLIAALQDLLARAAAAHVPPSQVYVDIWGDSQLVVNQVNGGWKINKSNLLIRCNQVRDLLQQFGFAALNYHPREESVAVLGH
jgi:ribonuclease HI